MRMSALVFFTLCGFTSVGCLDQPFATNVDLPLQVIQLSPTDGAVDVGRDAAITAIFNLPVVEASLADNVVVEDITDAAAPVTVAGTLTYTAPEGDNAPRAVFQPAALLPYSTTFRVTLKTGIERDTEPLGNLLRPTSATFTTQDPPALAVVSIVPGAGATGVDPATTIAVTFSEPVRCATVEAGLTVTQTFDAASPTTPGTTADVAGTVACTDPASIEDLGCDNGACTITFTQSQPPLALSSIITVSLAGGARADGAIESFRATDAGGQLPADVTSTFTILDPEPLFIVSAAPGNGSTQVVLNTGMVLTFSEALDCSTVSDADFSVLETLDDGTTGAAVTATAVCDGTTVTLSFSRAFEHSATVDVTVAADIESARATTRGGQLVGGALVTFTTQDPPPLLVFSSNPGNGSTGIGFDTDLTVQFSEDVDCATVTAGATTTTVDEVFSPAVAALRGAAGTTHTVVVDSCAGDTAVFAFDAEFELASSVTVVLPGTIASARATLAGGQLNGGASHAILFEIVPFPPVEVTDVRPPGPLIVATTSFIVTFNQDIFVPNADRLSADVDVFLAELPSAGAVPDLATAVDITCVGCTQGNTYTFAPTAPLSAGVSYALVVRGGPTGVIGAAGGSIALGDFVRRYIVAGGGLLISTDPADGDTDITVTNEVCATFLIDVQDAIENDPERDAFVVAATNDLGGQTALPGTLTFFGVDPLTGLPSATFTSNKVCFAPTPSTIPCRDNDELLPENTTITISFSFVDRTDLETPQTVFETRSFSTGGLPSLIDSFYETIPEVNRVGELTTEVPVNGTIVLVFDADIDVASLGAISLRTAGGVSVAATSTIDAVDENTVRLAPDANLTFNGGFVVDIAGGVTGGLAFDDGRSLGDDVAIAFTTSPANNARSSIISGENASEVTVSPVLFDRPMFLPSVNTNTITARDNTTGSAVEGGVASFVDAPFTAVFTAQPSYIAGNSVTLTVGTGALDFLGNPLPAAVTVTWPSIGGTAAAASNPPSPIITGNVQPNTGAVAATQRFRITMPLSSNGKLANRMVPSAFNDTSVVFQQTAACALGGAARTIATRQAFTVATVVQGSELIDVIAGEALRSGCAYRLTLKQRFFANIYLQQNSATAPDVVINVTGETTRPTLQPGNVTNVAGNATLVATFSEPINVATLAAATVNDGTGAVTGTFSTTGNTVVFTPAALWRTGLTYTATFPTTVADLAGNTLAAAATMTLQTETVAPVAPATVTTLGDTLVLTFNEALNPASVTPTTFGAIAAAGTVLVRAAGTAATIEACISVRGNTIVIDHIGAAAGTALEVVVTAGVTDAAGNPVARDTTLSATAP